MVGCMKVANVLSTLALAATVAVLGASVTAAVGPAKEASHVSRSPTGCPPKRPIRLLVGTPQAEIYETVETERVPGREIFGCAFGSKHSFLLGPTPPEGDRHATLAGSVAGYQVGGQGEWIVVSKNLRTGRLIHNVPTGRATHPSPKFDGAGPTTTIVVTRAGSVGWIAELGLSNGGYAVEAATSSGVKLLASGSEIDPQSLAIAGSTMYWTNGGKPFSASLH